MRRQDKPEVGRFPGDNLMTAAVTAGGPRRGDQAGRRRFFDFGCLGRIVAGIALCCAGALLFAALALFAPVPAGAQVSVGISVTFAPPALPVYVQPACPAPNYMWIPGYWAWDPDYGYYWVPGTWVLAPVAGWLWTPGYWGWYNGVYIWHDGYWGPEVGFYGGINYGFGYNGYGYYGGYWDRGRFHYNRAVNNIRTSDIRDYYRKPVPRSPVSGRVSFNGGRGGIALRPTAAQENARHRGSAPLAVQNEQHQAARRDPGLRASSNRGRPAVAATPRPGVFRGSGVVGADRAGAPYKAPPAVRPAAPAGEPGRPTFRQNEPQREQPRPNAVNPPTERRRSREHPMSPPNPAVPRSEPGRIEAPAPQQRGGEMRQNAPRHEQPRPPAVMPQMERQRAPERPMPAPHPAAPRVEPGRMEAPAPPVRGGREREEGRP